MCVNKKGYRRGGERREEEGERRGERLGRIGEEWSMVCTQYPMRYSQMTLHLTFINDNNIPLYGRQSSAQSPPID